MADGGIVQHDGSVRDLDEMMVTMAEAFDTAFGEAWNRAQCAGIFDLPGVALVLARCDGEAAGFALIRTVFDEAELLLLAVRPAFRRRGIGHALLASAQARARAAGARRMHLEVREGNLARRLYDNAGFTHVGTRRAYYRGKDGQLFDATTLDSSLDER